MMSNVQACCGRASVKFEGRKTGVQGKRKNVSLVEPRDEMGPRASTHLMRT